MDLVREIPGRMKEYSPIWRTWKLEEQIGSGYHSAVFTALSENEKKEAVKAMTTVLRRGEADQAERIEKELKQILQLENYKNIITPTAYVIKTLRDSETKQVMGYDIIVRMKYLCSLERMIKENTSFSEREVITLGSDLARGLADAKRNKIFHGSVKPSNIFVRKDSSEKPYFCLGDFGSALLKGGWPQDVYSVSYMAPELYQSGSEGQMAGDIYGLGLVLFQLLNQNRLPFCNEGETNLKQALKERMQGKAFPELERLSSDIDEVILRCCSYQPSLRYQSYEELLADLEECEKLLERKTGWAQNTAYKKTVSDAHKESDNTKSMKWMAWGIGAIALVCAGAFWFSRSSSGRENIESSDQTLSSETNTEGSSEMAAGPAAEEPPTEEATTEEFTTEEPTTEEPTTEESTTEEPTTEELPTEYLPVSIEDRQIQVLLRNEDQWRRGMNAEENAAGTGTDGIGFVDLDQDRNFEFIYGRVSQTLTGVDADRVMNYDIYSIKEEQMELLGSCKTLDLKYNPQTGQTVLFGNVYTVGVEDQNGFSGCIESEETSLVEGELLNRKLFTLWRKRSVGSGEETRTFFITDENGVEREVGYQEYEQALNAYTSQLQPSSAKRSYLNWNGDWEAEQKKQIMKQAYEMAK